MRHCESIAHLRHQCPPSALQGEMNVTHTHKHQHVGIILKLKWWEGGGGEQYLRWPEEGFRLGVRDIDVRGTSSLSTAASREGR